MRSFPLVRMAPTVFLAAVALPSAVYPFSFTYSNTVACENLEIQWTGGTPPFQFLITPTFGTPRNYPIPNNAFDGTKGTFKTQLQMRPVGSQQVDQFLLTMSDARGFGTGGTSALLTASSPSTGVTCNVTDPGVDFNFELPNSLQQCRAFGFTQYIQAVQPVTIYGLIPSGESFQLNPPLGPPNFDWTVNVAAKTSLVLFMVDSRGRQGGSSDLLIVGNSDEARCLSANSPSSTASSPTSSLSSSTPTETPTPTSDDSNNGRPKGVVIGGVIVGSIVALVAIGTLAVFLYKHCRSNNEPPSAYFSSGKRGARRVHSIDLAAAQPNDPQSPPVYPPQEYHASPFVFHPQSGHGLQRQDEYSIPPYSPSSGVPGGRHFNAAPSSYSGEESAIYTQDPFQGNTTPGSAQYLMSRGTSVSSKAAMAGMRASVTPRFVLHTDAGTMDEEEHEVVELPPTYNDVSKEMAPNTPTATTQIQSPTTSAYSYSGGASAVDVQSHPLAPSPILSNRSDPSTPPILPPLDHQPDEFDSFDLGSGLALGLESPPHPPHGTRDT